MDQQKPLQEKFKKVQRKAVLKLVALLLVVATLIATATWSWFTEPDQQATAEGLTMLLETQESLKMSVNGSDWTTALDLSSAEFLSDLDMVPVTGSGGTLSAGGAYLYIPVVNYDAYGEPTVNRTATWTLANANKDYIDLEIKFRSPNPVDIYIGAGTAITTECEELGLPLSGVEAGNKSRYGDFSRDAIVGALRMSVCDSDGDLICLWIPRPDVALVENSTTGELSLKTGVSSTAWSERHYYYDKDSKEVVYLNGCASTSAAFTALADNANSANAASLIGSAETVESIDDTDYYTCTAYIRIWVDGYDEDSARALSRGKFKINLSFVAVDK